MNIKVLSYLDPSYLEKTSGGADSARAAAGSSFDEILDDAINTSDPSSESAEGNEGAAEDAVDPKVQNLMEIDAAIAEAKLSGASGLSVNSARAQELGVSAYYPATTTVTAYYPTYSSYTGITANTYTDVLQCSDELNAYFDEASSAYQVDVKLLKAIAKAESNFSASAVSSAGAIGIMQLMPATASGLGVSDSYNAYENIMGGAKYISQLLAKYKGDTSLALAAYNAGSSKVDQYGGIPPYAETQNYVQKVLQYYGS